MSDTSQTTKSSEPVKQQSKLKNKPETLWGIQGCRSFYFWLDLFFANL